MRIARGTLVALAIGGGAAHADSKAADAKFTEGKALLAQGHYAEACKAFEDSNALDPGIGAQLNIAHCFEEWGKLATAYRAYLAAETMATTARDRRVPQIHERVEALDPQVPRLTLQVAKDADTTGLEITIDGAAIEQKELGTEMRLDPGPHTIEYRRGGVAGTKRSRVVAMERGGSSEITLDLPHLGAAKVVDKKVPADGAGGAEAGHGRRVAGVVAVGVGGVAMGVAGVLTLSARGKYKDALAKSCGGDTTMCDDEGLKATHAARHEANAATVVFGVGAAVAVTGVVLYLTAPRGGRRAEHATRVVPVVGGDGAGLAVIGSF